MIANRPLATKQKERELRVRRAAQPQVATPSTVGPFNYTSVGHPRSHRLKTDGQTLSLYNQLFRISAEATLS